MGQEGPIANCQDTFPDNSSNDSFRRIAYNVRKKTAQLFHFTFLV